MGKVIDVLAAIKAIPEVKSAHGVIGPYDIIAFIEFSDPEALKSIIIDKIQKVPGISRTLTCIAA
ncbi:MAG: Lrp/AsnC family transcriptional regulator [Actinobacteria bacterium]|nr:Lrp/AsnC family transcriptional regulator [Actinomycetota bacterium]